MNASDFDTSRITKNALSIWFPKSAKNWELPTRDYTSPTPSEASHGFRINDKRKVKAISKRPFGCARRTATTFPGLARPF